MVDDCGGGGDERPGTMKSNNIIYQYIDFECMNSKHSPNDYDKLWK